MNAIAIPQPRSLTEQQERFVAHFVASGCTPTEAARKAEFAAPAQEAYRLMRKPHVMAAIKDERQRVIGGSLCNIAVKTLAEIMADADAPAAARVGACRITLAMGGYLDKASREDDEKELHEMTEAELLGFMARAQAVVDAGGGAPVIEIIGERPH